MGNGQHTSLPSGFAGGRRARRPAAQAPWSAGAAVAVATAAVGAGVLVAVAAGLVVGVPAGEAAAIGALGAIAASVVGAAGMALLRRTDSARDRELVDAASPLHPLLKRLVTEAPGTYVHSVAAANLSEAGAEALGADPLVARVGAYYHDVGKLTQPRFFFENQEDEENPHEGAGAAESADIIMAHVTDGVVLGNRYRLPRRVVDIIQQHHGTSLVRYFYHKAAAESGVAVYESDFRYQGAKPQSKEAAIVMLADGSEASVRAMTTPDPAQVEAAVRDVFAERAADGQLTDAGLSDRDLEVLVAVFAKQLVSFRHVRCPYPRYADLCAEEGSDADQRREPSRS
jgi:hypothetical protein